MDNFLWLDQTDWSAISAITSAATFIGGLVAVIIAFKQIQHARDVHADQVRPYVIVDVEPNPTSWFLYDIVIRNIGQTPATNCSIKLDPKPVRSRESEQDALSDARIFNEPIAMLAPGREIRLFFDSMFDRLETELPMLYRATVSYSSPASDAPWTEHYTLDLAALKGTSNVDVYTVHHAAKALREIQKKLDRSPLLKGTVEAVTEGRRERRERLTLEREEQLRRFRQREQGEQQAPEHGGQDESA